MSSATSASVGPSPSSGAKTAAVAVERPVDALGDLVGRRAPASGRRSRPAASRRAVATPNRAVRGRECLLGHASTSRVDCVSVRGSTARREHGRAGRRRRARPSFPATAKASRVPPCAVSAAGDQAAERRASHEGEEVEARRPAAQVLGRRELQRRERARAPEDVEDPGHEQHGADGGQRCPAGRARAATRRSRRAPPSTSSRRALPIVARISAPQSAPAPKTEAIRPNVPAPCIERQPGHERQQHVEVERERAQTSRTVKNVTATRRELTANESASPTPRARRAAGRRGAAGRKPHREDRADHDRVADRVQREGDAGPGGGDDEARRRRGRRSAPSCRGRS